jgi:hypothetical protein
MGWKAVHTAHQISSLFYPLLAIDGIYEYKAMLDYFPFLPDLPFHFSCQVFQDSEDLTRRTRNLFKVRKLA